MNPFLIVPFLVFSLSIAFPSVRADELDGTGSVSGRVASTEPLVAGSVYLREPKRNLTYMVYTADGRFSAPYVLPGNYEVTVEQPGLVSTSQQVSVSPGAEITIDLEVEREGQGVRVVGSRPVAPVAFAGYEEIYPPGPGRDTLERTCIVCHGVNWISQRSGNDATAWTAFVDMMLNMNDSIWGIEDGTPMMPPGAINAAQRKELIAYLAEHFGPDQPARMVRNDEDLPLDQAALGKAMWVEYTVAQPKSPDGQNRWIQEPYFDLQGNVWYTERTRGAPAILKLDPRTGEFTRFPTPNPQWSPHGLVVDPQNPQMLWWAGRGVEVTRMDMKTGEMTPYGDTSNPQRWGGHTPVFDSRGNLWWTQIAADRIGYWDRKTDELKHFDIPNKGGRPYGILVDHDDKVWFAEFYGCQVTRFDPETESFTEYTLPSSPCTSRRLGLDSKGIIWYGAFSSGKLGRIDPKTGEMKEYRIGRFSEPYEAWADPDDKIWLTDGGQGGMLVRFDPDTEQFTYYPSPRRSDMPKMAITGEGAVWYSNRSYASSGHGPATVGVLYPDVSRMTTLGAYYQVDEWGKAYGSGSPHPAKPTR
ncbi:virginiamycin B lyase family protein [Elongatibacter sediminis]|uniref:SMP-30/gluconolactonase/LRE family protein n=1 Tax=Elongatibacter sediminis TaxID=3119006 RepID=A0AAW9RAL9_9GAMM